MAKVGEMIETKRAYALHWWAIKQWWKMEPRILISSVLYAVVSAVIPFVTVWFSAQIIGELTGERNPQVLFQKVLWTVLVTAGLSALSAGLKRYKEAVHGSEQFIESRMYNDKFLDMDYAAVEATSTRDILYEVKYHCQGNVYGFQNVQSFYVEAVIKCIAAILSATVLLLGFFTGKVPDTAEGMLWLNSLLVNIGMMLLLVAGVFFSQKLNSLVGKLHVDKMYVLNNRYNRYCNSMGALGWRIPKQLDVRIYNQQEVVWKALEKHENCKKGSEGAKIYRQMGWARGLGGATEKLMMGVIYLVVCLKAWAGAFDIGAATQYIGAITAVCAGIVEIFFVIADVPSNAAFLDTIKNFMDIPEEMYKGSLTTEKRRDRNYEVEFKNVSFKYPGTDKWALRNVSFKFDIGKRIAIVGENGSGKTTFIKLLCRLYDPQEGQILLNGIDIHKYKYRDYMDIFSVVFQDFGLLAASVGENVAGSKTYDEERVLKAIRDAGFAERLSQLPGGLETQLYKNFTAEGVEPSGGEAQKIAIARALYKDAPFIILDEPTAALDPVAEAEIYAKFNDIVGDKTAVYISHRLSSCRFCDEIIVFHEGTVVQQGTHETLVADEKGQYHRLWHAQAQYYVEENEKKMKTK